MIVEAERNGPLIALLIKRRLGIGEILTRNDDPVLDQVRHGRIVGGIHHRRASRRATVDRFLHRHGLIHHLEGQLGGLAENVLETLRILQARHLNQNAVRALALDDRLGGAEFVDAAADHFNRLLNGGAGAIGDAGIGQRQTEQALLRLVQRQFRHTAGAEQAGRDRRGQAFERRARSIDLLRITNPHLNGAVGAGKAGIADPRIAQGGADRIACRFKTIVDQVLLADLQKDVRATLQIEAKRHGALWEPVRQRVDRLLRQHVWNRDQNAEGYDEPDGDGLPAGKIKHVASIGEKITAAGMPPRMRLFLGVLVGDRLALDAHIGQRGTQRRHFQAVAEVDF